MPKTPPNATRTPDPTRWRRVGLGVVLVGLLLGALFLVAGTSLRTLLADLRVFVPLLRKDRGQALIFDGAQAMQYAWEQCAFGPRPPGSEALRRAGDAIVTHLAAEGWEVEEQRFEYRGVALRNIIARKGAGTPLIVGAHYDTRAIADHDPDPAKRTQPVPGGNDGASGVAVLLELARVLDVTATGHEIWLAFFDGEDNGSGGLPGWDWIVGSTYMAQHLSARPDVMILLDMIGDQDQRIPWEAGSTPWLRETIWQVAEELGFGAHFIPQVGYNLIDDHRPFLARGIPAVDIIDFDYPYWHTTQDTCDKLSADSLARVGRVVEFTLEERRLNLARETHGQSAPVRLRPRSEAHR